MGLSDRGHQKITFIFASLDRIDEDRPRSMESFLFHPRTQDAITWRLQAISDACRNKLTDEIRNRHPEIDWKAVYGFRNIAAHQYADINLDLVWEIIIIHLTPLRSALAQELELNRG